MISATLSRSPLSSKKWRIFLTDGAVVRTIDFGARGYQDFTQHGDLERRTAYLSRHAARENWRDPYSAGFWLLWEHTTLLAAARAITRRSGIRIKLPAST